ncbi:MAG: AAA family ATPase [Planctomycetota bacterium]|jgi:predicted ATPase|nr:AAA family ATPase [Planctomycetota bacterium]
MIISEIGLRNWKNFAAAAVSCGKRVFLIGPNAAGKSNFLDAPRFLRDVALDGLAKAVACRGGMEAVRWRGTRGHSGVTVTAVLDRAWEYSLSFKANRKHEPVVSGERVFCLDGKRKSTLLDRPDAGDEKDPPRLAQTALQQVGMNGRFRPIADFFASIQYRRLLPGLPLAARSLSPSADGGDPFGLDLAPRIWSVPAKSRDARLRKINALLAAAVPDFKSLSLEPDPGAGFPRLRISCGHWRSRRACRDESSLSDGTLRLIALLWSLLDADGPLLLEEPELSLHGEIVRRLPQLFALLDKTGKKAGRQLFVATHAEALLDDADIGADEILRFEPGGGGTAIKTADPGDERLMRDGLSAADVLLPKTRPPRLQGAGWPVP